ncbi:MAG: nucleotide exchange factor GrpE [Treponema sp.]|jgi:molecular chaperone GrpE|nr:nucleotide exchange factor GrpE [Treponema sp.]
MEEEEFTKQTEGPLSGCGCEASEAGEATERLELQDGDEKIAALEAELAERNDQFLRKAAEFENFRKRMNREKQDAIDYANQSLLLDLIPVIDDFERAMQSAAVSKDFNSLYEGIGMTERRLITMLENLWALKRFDSAGEAFDPNRHEAIMMEKSAEVSEPVVQEDFIKGYTLKDRVIRSAKVKVIMPESPSTQTAESSSTANSPSEGIQSPGAEKAGD